MREKNVLAKGLEKLSRKTLKVNSEKRCYMYLHQPREPKGIKNFLLSK
ncbi:cyclic lactone autoinducer peptide [Butyrivibrio sp. X503]|nr:cyclic lactone autoinducer peptide [Butyrivibrio sp. X503]RKM53918.1 cyclic lactone autoinducer peptide [Butyrivibrio sp. X503]